MAKTSYRNRRAFQIENRILRVTVLEEGGHVAEILHKPSGVNPLWTPPWRSIDPSAYRREQHPEYGVDSESKLLAGIMGHNLCLDLFGGPSPEEAAAEITVHGEASVAPYQIEERAGLVMRARLPAAQLAFERSISLDPTGKRVLFRESVENLSALDRPIAWTQHVTLGPPFLKGGATQFRASATRSRVYESSFGGGNYMKIGADFDWPMVPLERGGTADLRVYNSSPVSAGFSTHLMDPHRDQAFFAAWSPESKVLFGYKWKRADFPWLGIWEENRARKQPPWNGQAVTRGMEFGASPMPETRRQMITRGQLFGVPAYRWLPARSKISTEYEAFIGMEERIPDEV